MKKEIKKYLLVFISLIAIFFTYSVLVCSLPNKTIKKNVTKSVSDMVMPDGENYPYAIIHKQECKMDNFTDAIILSQNYTIDNKQPLKSAMYGRFAKLHNFNIVEALERQTNSEEIKLINYPRYWFGSTFLIRPFLLFTNYTVIRWVLYAVSSILFLVLGIKLFKITGTLRTVAFFMGLLFVNVFVTQFSIQFFSVVALSTIFCILICNHFENRKKILLLSFIIGCLTSYFDLLTTPLLTCGLPLIVYLLAEKEKVFSKRISTLLLFCLLWGIGYAFTWASKWGLGTIFTDMNVFQNAMETALYRTSIETNSRTDAIIANFSLLPLFIICLILSLLFPLVILFFNKKAIKTNLLLLLLTTFPYFWYLVLAQHTWWHYWFTYRIQAISISAIFIIFINFINWDKVSNFFRKKQNLKSGVAGLLIIPVSVFLFSSCCKKSCNSEMEKPNYQDFFIAHAGGAIDGIIYTNSLEAMNLSYSKGCRLFELDLVLSVDDKIVALHDWPASTPLTEEEFMNTLIEGKYTPMNMDAINRWFENHPDAIFITDKINNPDRVYKEFLFPDRLIMELASWEAVDRAIELGIKPLLSDRFIIDDSYKVIEKHIINGNSMSIEQLIEEKNIQFICMSHVHIAGNEDFVLWLKKKGVKNYLWGLDNIKTNGETSEEYIWNHFMNFCYGMYADNFDFLASLMNGEKPKKNKFL